MKNSEPKKVNSVRWLIAIVIFPLLFFFFYLFRDSLFCNLGIYQSCEILITSKTIEGRVLEYKKDKYQFKLSASAILRAYIQSPQCRELADDFSRGIETNDSLHEALCSAPCRAVGPMEAIISSAREGNLVLSIGENNPETIQIAFIRYGFIHEKLIIWNGDTILEESHFR